MKSPHSLLFLSMTCVWRVVLGLHLSSAYRSHQLKSTREGIMMSFSDQPPNSTADSTERQTRESLYQDNINVLLTSGSSCLLISGPHLGRTDSTTTVRRRVTMLQQTEGTGVQEQGRVYELRSADRHRKRPYI